jgi:hypothetical protein
MWPAEYPVPIPDQGPDKVLKQKNYPAACSKGNRKSSWAVCKASGKPKPAAHKHERKLYVATLPASLDTALKADTMKTHTGALRKGLMPDRAGRTLQIVASAIAAQVRDNIAGLIQRCAVDVQAGHLVFAAEGHKSVRVVAFINVDQLNLAAFGLGQCLQKTQDAL